MKYRGVMTIPGTFRVATAVRAANFRLRFLVPALAIQVWNATPGLNGKTEVLTQST